jgi:hypothetical protein
MMMMKNGKIITVALVTTALILILITMKETTSIQATDKKGNGCRPGVVASQAEIKGLQL